MPVLELASENALILTNLSGSMSGEGGLAEERNVNHQSRSLCVCFGGVRGLNGES